MAKCLEQQIRSRVIVGSHLRPDDVCVYGQKTFKFHAAPAEGDGPTSADSFATNFSPSFLLQLAAHLRRTGIPSRGK